MKSPRSTARKSRARSARRASTCWSATGPTAIRRSPASSKAAAAPACRFICGTSRAAEPEELPQVLTPAMLISRARRRALGARCHTFLPADPGFDAPACGQRLRIDRGRIAVDDDEIGPFAGLEAADLVLGEAGISRVAREAGERLLEASPAPAAASRPAAGRCMSCRLTAAARPGKGLGDFDREVRPEGQPRAAPGDRLPRISAGRAAAGRAALRPSSGRWSGGSAASRR